MALQVNVSGKHLDVGEALRSRVSDDLSTSISKYFERGGDADVVIQKDGHGFRVDCSVTLASGRQLNSHGQGGDAYAAFNDALAKIDKRVRRYKRRLKDHSEAANARELETAALYVLRTPEEEEEAWDESSEHPAGAPSALVIAETATDLRTMTVAMAVMELDLTDTQAIVFRNAAHGGLSVVYRRPDGNIGWVDPERTKPAKGNGIA